MDQNMDTKSRIAAKNRKFRPTPKLHRVRLEPDIGARRI